MENIELNEHLRLDVKDFVESEHSEMTSSIMPDGMTKWTSRGTIYELNAKAIYYTSAENNQQIEENGGDWEDEWIIDRLHRVEIVTEDDVPVVTIYNPDYYETD